jgi:hypothetical protein
MKRSLSTTIPAVATLFCLIATTALSAKVNASQPQVTLTQRNIHLFAELSKGFACYAAPGERTRLGKLETSLSVGSTWRDLHVDRVLQYFDHLKEKLAQHDAGVVQLTTVEVEDIRLISSQLEKRIDSLLALYQSCSVAERSGESTAM